jgi:predicted ATPase
MVSLPSQTFVGRDKEMETLIAALDDAVAGRGRLVMLAGEPGIGKTRLAQELARKAQERECKVLWGW